MAPSLGSYADGINFQVVSGKILGLSISLPFYARVLLKDRKFFLSTV